MDALCKGHNSRLRGDAAGNQEISSLFISEIPHLVSSEHDSPQVTESTGSEIMHKMRLLYNTSELMIKKINF